jgi:ketosteroid isomerase-like protein
MNHGRAAAVVLAMLAGLIGCAGQNGASGATSMMAEDVGERPEWDEKKVARLVGRKVLVGITRPGPVAAAQEQMFGVIRSANSRDGFEVALSGSRSGETYWLPPDPSSFAPAAPGEYRLRSTGEIVVNPDFVSTWRLNGRLSEVRYAGKRTPGRVNTMCGVIKQVFSVTMAVVAIGLAPDAHAEEPTRWTAAASAPLSPAATEAANVVDAFRAALSRGDGPAALSLLADDVLILEAGGAERSKAEYAAHHLEADMAFATAVPERVGQRAGMAAGDLAWIASEGRSTGRFNDKPVDRITAETMVLRRERRGWLITHIHWSSAPSRS